MIVALKIILIWAGISPVFLVLSVSVNQVALDEVSIARWCWVAICSFMFVAPNLIVFERLRVSRKKGIKKSFRFSEVSSARESVIAYIFSMMTPFLTFGIDSIYLVLLYFFVLLLISRIFYIYDFLYFNVVFAFLGIRVFLCGGGSQMTPKVVLSRRNSLPKGVEAEYIYILSGVYFLELEERK